MGTPTWWLGSALCWGALVLTYYRRHTLLLPWVRRLPGVTRMMEQSGHRRAPFYDVLYGLSLVTVALLMMSSALLDERPVSHDHTVHYVKAWQLKQFMLPQGRLFGWSHRFFAGYPANYLYPIGADLWVVLFYGLGCGALTFSQAYGVAFTAFFVLSGLAGYRFGRAFFGPLAGFVTGLLLLTDLADFRMGGWAYTIEFGVWPQALALSFSLLALAELPAIFSGRDLRSIALFGLFMGLSILTHPVVLLFLGLMITAAVIASLLARHTSTPSAVARLACACALAFAIASLWLIPFFENRKFTTAMGVFWDTTYQMGRDLLSLSTFKGTLEVVLCLGSIALCFALRRRDFRHLFVAIGALLVPLVSSSSFVDELHLAQLSPAFTKIQFLRMATMVKPLWFALCGLAVLTLVRYRRPSVRRQPSEPQAASQPAGRQAPQEPLRTIALHVLVAFLILPFLLPLAQVFVVDHILKHQRTVHDRELLDDRIALTRYLKAELPEAGFYRLGIFMGHNHELIDLATELARPIYKHGFTPCTNFIYKMESQDIEILKAVRVRYVISKQPPSARDYRQVKRFGVYGLYEFRRYDPQPFDLLEGQAHVRMRRFEDERIAFDVAPGAAGRLQLPVSWFPRWHASRDGVAIPIRPRSLQAEPEKTAFITVPLQAGHYELRFERSAGDHFAVVLGLFSLLLAVCLWLSTFHPGLRARGERALERLQWLDHLGDVRYRPLHLGAAGVLGTIVVSTFVLLSQWRPPLIPDEHTGFRPPRRVRFDFVEQLSGAHAGLRFRGYSRPCLTMGAHLLCPDAEGNLDSDRYVGSQPTTIEEYRMVRCIRARPEPGAALDITFPRVPRGRRMVGYYGIDFESRLLFYRRPVDFSIALDGRQAYRAATQRDNYMHWFELKVPQGAGTVDVTFSVSAVNPERRWFCFEAQMADG